MDQHQNQPRQQPPQQRHHQPHEVDTLAQRRQEDETLINLELLQEITQPHHELGVVQTEAQDQCRREQEELLLQFDRVLNFQSLTRDPVSGNENHTSL
jgi:hypothetical protein